MDNTKKILKEIDQYIIAYAIPPTGMEVAGTCELLERCRDLIRQLTVKDRNPLKSEEEIEYGAFAKNNITGKEDLLFRTTCSELLCRNRAAEEINVINALNDVVVYDLNSVRIRQRIIHHFIDEWHDEVSADDQTPDTGK